MPELWNLGRWQQHPNAQGTPVRPSTNGGAVATRVNRGWLALVGALGLGATGCASTRISSDLARVQELTRMPLPGSVTSSQVEAETSRDVRELLKKPLTADAAVRVALLNNRELRASLRDLGVARGQYVQAGLLPNPSFEFDLRRAADPTLPLQADFLLEYDLTRAILAPMRAGAAHADLEAARYRSAGSVVETGYSVRAAFYAFQAAAQRLAVATRVLDAFAASRDAARALFEAGNVPELDVSTQEAAYEGARATVAQVELEQLDQRERLHRLLGLHGEETAWTAQDALPAPPEQADVPADLERRTIKASLALAETRSRLEAIARRTGLARTEGWLPDVSVDVHAERDELAWAMGGGAKFTLPIFDRKQGTIAARESEFDALMERYHGAAIDTRSAAREARNHLKTTHARARQFHTVIVPARKRVLEQTLLQYNAMQVGVFQLLEARRQQLDAELAYIDTLRDYWTSRAALDALLAGRRVGLPTSASSSGMGGASEASGGH
jgi:cobalt-zinc-cadmium efflux system outer membrane protein